MKKILFICDPLESLKLNTDATYSLIISAFQLGYTVFYTLPQNIYAQNNTAYTATATQLNIIPKSALEADIVITWFDIIKIDYNIEITDFDATLVRNDPPFNMEYYYLTQILSLAQNKGARIINDSYALRNFNEKLAILNFPELISPTIVTKNKDVILNFLNNYNECVIKPLDLMAGRSVFKISKTDTNCAAIIETITDYFSQTIMLQQFIPDVIKGDKRIFVVNGTVVDHYLLRVPGINQIRSNIAAGGSGYVHKITSDDYKIANTVAIWLKANNIHFAGLDIIGAKLNEINITSPTGVRQILNFANIDISRMFFETLFE
jgi:glutathione synthase